MQDTTDHGPQPYVTNIETATVDNTNYRTTLWTGDNLQVTVMAIPAGGEVGLEVHDDHDQFLRIEQGQATVYMGPDKETLTTYDAGDDDAVFVPAGTWHNLVNSGTADLKLYSVYAPAEHPHGTVHATKDESDEDEEE